MQGWPPHKACASAGPVVAKLSRAIKRNLRHLFKELDFSRRVDAAPLTSAITLMQDMFRQDKSLRQADASNFPDAIIVRIPAIADSDSILMADTIPR